MLKKNNEIKVTSLCNDCGALFSEMPEQTNKDGEAFALEPCPVCGAPGHWIVSMFPGSHNKSALHAHKCLELITEEIGMTRPDTFDKLKVRKVPCYDMEDEFLILFCEDE